MKKLLLLAVVFVVTFTCYAQAPTEPGGGNPTEEVEIRGRYYSDSQELLPNGDIVITIVCSVVFNEWCIKVKSPFDSPINPQTQNGPIPAQYYYKGVQINNAATTTVTGNVTAHYQNLYQGDLNYREHRFFIDVE